MSKQKRNNSSDFKKEALQYSSKKKIEIKIMASLNSSRDFSLAYTPGIAEVCKEIQQNPENINKYSFRGNALAVISDGSAVLGLGNIGDKASYPVMEGKSMIFKKFANIDAIPIILNSQNPQEVINTVKNISNSFSAINLEDIAAPQCFEIEESVKKQTSIPIMHDDQHGTAIVILAALINATKLTSRTRKAKIVISGAGAAGIAITNLLYHYGFKNILVLDSKGIINKNRKDLNKYKTELLQFTNKQNIEGGIKEAIKDAEVFIGVSKPNILDKENVKRMKSPIIFSLANPVPEIMPEEAKKGGAVITATGRSDLNNQINNALVFPGLFKGVIKARIPEITEEIKLTVAQAIVEYHRDSLSKQRILPDVWDKNVHNFIAERIQEFSRQK